MPPVWKPRDNDTLKVWLEAIVNEASEQLNDWEMTFIENIGVKVLSGWTLTQAQEEKLESIYAKYTD